MQPPKPAPVIREAITPGTPAAISTSASSSGELTSNRSRSEAWLAANSRPTASRSPLATPPRSRARARSRRRCAPPARRGDRVHRPACREHRPVGRPATRGPRARGRQQGGRPLAVRPARVVGGGPEGPRHPVWATTSAMPAGSGTGRCSSDRQSRSTAAPADTAGRRELVHEPALDPDVRVLGALGDPGELKRSAAGPAGPESAQAEASSARPRTTARMRPGRRGEDPAEPAWKTGGRHLERGARDVVHPATRRRADLVEVEARRVTPVGRRGPRPRPSSAAPGDPISRSIATGRTRPLVVVGVLADEVHPARSPDDVDRRAGAAHRCRCERQRQRSFARSPGPGAATRGRSGRSGWPPTVVDKALGEYAGRPLVDPAIVPRGGPGALRPRVEVRITTAT